MKGCILGSPRMVPVPSDKKVHSELCRSLAGANWDQRGLCRGEGRLTRAAGLCSCLGSTGLEVAQGEEMKHGGQNQENFSSSCATNLFLTRQRRSSAHMRQGDAWLHPLNPITRLQISSSFAPLQLCVWTGAPIGKTGSISE